MRKHEKSWKGEPGRQVLEVRVRAARLAWLDAPLSWREGRVFWGELAPGPADIRKAHAALFRIRSMPLSGAKALGDHAAWLQRKEALLALAQRLSTLPDAPLETLDTPAAVELLAAEALCTNPLPDAPSGLLLRRAHEAAPALEAFLRAPETPEEARPLAALILGACHGRGAEGLPPALYPIRPYYEAGLAHGLPVAPVLMVHLLQTSPAQLPAFLPLVPLLPEPWRDESWLRRQFRPAPDDFVMAIDALVVAFREARKALRESPELAALAFASDGTLPTLTETLRFIATLHAQQTPACPLIPSIQGTLDAVATLPDAQRGPCLAFLTERHKTLWPVAEGQARKSVAKQRSWQRACVEKTRPLIRAFARYQDPELIREAEKQGILLSSPADPENLRSLLSFRRFLGIEPGGYLMHPLGYAFKTLKPADLKRALQPLLAALHGIPLSERESWAESICDQVLGTREGLCQQLPRLGALIPRVRRLRLPEHEKNSAVLEALAELERERGASGAVLQDELFALVSRQRERVKPASLAFATRFALALRDQSEATFPALLETLATRTLPRNHWQLTDALPHLKTYPGLRATLTKTLPVQTERCLRLLQGLALGTSLGAASLAPLTTFDTPETPLPAGWATVSALVPELDEDARAYCHSQRLRGLPDTPPPGLLKTLALPQRLEAERAYLTTRPELAARLANVEARLADPEHLLKTLHDEAHDRLRSHAAEARLTAAETLLTHCYQSFLDTLLSHPDQPIPDTEDWKNAAILAANVTANRALLIGLLQALLQGNPSWARALPENQAFLEQLAASGVDTACWHAENAEQVAVPTLPGGSARLWLANDPLAVLQMGNHFDTCLSVWNFNAFSTIANAVESNKRVIFAADSRGRIVARKLLAITAEGELLGFHTYLALDEEQGRASLEAAVLQYARAFAERCKLPLANSGSVSKLLADDWYDDGSVPWEADPQSLEIE